ncbi:MAG TPA: biotin carboxylase N-terminal domain-containing protein [Acetobacteraceae bacterium]|nr:biotin carboxylase N-terminal domain-containing protein [Acetobacteraceae bacterium]
MFRTLLIANRGEIACRIARTARVLDIETVAVFSDADADALHVRTADRAFRVGPAAARESYLDIARIIAAAQESGAQAVHPGYGFLSENPAFAEACVAAGLVFVGPPADAMRAMGSKSAAKALMQRFGVPLLPGYHGDNQDPAFLAAQACGVGFPVVIKAVSGGGGRGMRVVQAATEFDAALREARQEAAAAFGDDRVLIERYLQHPRHIEVQVFADTHGNAVHLFERDCSVQRRHQKVIEEAPAPGIDPRRRAAMGEAAIAAARAVGYVGAGTVEFVADAAGFFFLEMNTRLQVEHPVTEMVTGFDLVEWQLRVAAGEVLPATQQAIRLSGHAIEARLYAEDPSRDFAPSIGRLVAFRLPAPTASIRADTGFAAGDTVSVHYDAMLAKLIVHGATREAALATLRGALAACDVVGVASNLDLLHRIVVHPAFAAGGVDTSFIARHAGTLLAAQGTPPEEVLAAAALAVLTDAADAAVRQAAAGADPYSPWQARDQWWLNAAAERVLEFHAGETIHPVTVRHDGAAWLLTIGDSTLPAAAVRSADGSLDMALGDARFRVRVTHDGETLSVRRNGATFRFGLPDPVAHAEDADESGGRLVAPLPGQVTQILVEPGAVVTRGQILVVLEAMKTVFRLTAPADAAVEHMSCQVGEMVQEGQVLVTFVEPEVTA